MNRPTIFLLSILAASAPAGCGGQDARLSDAAGEEDPSARAEVEVPDFVIPAPGGALRVLMHTEAQLVVDYPPNELERVVAFYDEWTASQAETYTRLGSGVAESVSWDNGEGDQGFRSILVVRAGPSGKTFVGVTLSAN